MRSMKSQQQQGSVLILFAVTLVVLMGFVGLALDSGTGYLAQAKLSAAVDGAALAGSMAAARGNDQAGQRQNAIAAVTSFFNANYPDHSFGMTPSLSPPDISFGSDGSIAVEVKATAHGATSFMQLLGKKELTVAAAAGSSRRPIDLALALDVSLSLVGSSDWQPVVAGTQNFFQQMSPQADRAAITVFGSRAVVAVPFDTSAHQFSMPGIQHKLDAMADKSDPDLHYAMGGTDTYDGMQLGIDQLTKVITSPSPTQILLVVTDGVPNRAPAGISPVQGPLDLARQARASGVYVFVLGFGSQVDPPYLKNLANTSDASNFDSSQKPGLYCDANDSASLQGCYAFFASQALKLSR